MNKTKIITIIFSVLTLFLGFSLVFWTIIPYANMLSTYSKLQNAVDDNPAEFLNLYTKPLTLDYTQPELQYAIFTYVLDKYLADKNFLGGDQFLFNIIDRMKELTKYEGNYATMYIALGRAYDILAQIHPEASSNYRSLAQTEYEQALKLFPNYPSAYYSYVINLANQGKKDQALNAINQVLTNDPRVPESQYYHGVILYSQNPNNANQALQDLESAIDSRGVIDQTLTRVTYEKMMQYYYLNQDIPHITIVLKRLSQIEPDQSQVFNKILDYITTKNSLPIINLKSS